MSKTPIIEPDIDNIDPHYIFKNKPEEYQVNLKPLKEYFRQATKLVLKTIPDLSAKEASAYIKLSLKENGIKNPIVKFNKKNDFGDMVEEEDTLSSYIDESVEAGEVMAPSFTTYIHPSKSKSLHATFLQENIQKRKIDKGLQFKYKQEGNKEKETYHGTMQKIRKIYNNSLSGAYGSKSTILYNPSAHYTLTSMTRSVASIGNVTSESVVAGNKYFKDPDVTISYITAVITNAPKFAMRRAMNKYKLHIPSTDELMNMVLYSSRLYWKDLEKEKTIKLLLDSLDDVERCAVMYCNDLWHLMKYNDALMRDIVKSISTKKNEGSVDLIGDLTTAPEGVANLTHHVCKDTIKGMKVNYEDLQKSNPEILTTLASTAKGITEGLVKYGVLFKAFYATDIMPTSVAYVKDMLRDTIVLSDTDSTCGSYDKWIEWYFGSNRYDEESVGVSAAIMTLNTQIMDHHLKIFARNMNVDSSLVELLKMKNEFYWPVFVASNVSKHYFADTEIQEGNVYSKSDLELKGVHLIASSIRPDIAKFAHDMMSDIMEEIKLHGAIEVTKYIKRVADKEREIIDAVLNGDTSLFKFETIKEQGAYKDKDRSPYQFYALWQRIFKNKYGDAGKPSIRMIKTHLKIKNKTMMKEFLENIADPDIRKEFNEYAEEKGMDKLEILRIPATIADEKGLPEEIKDYLNINKIASENLSAVYYVLECIGFYRKGDLLVHEHDF